MVVSVVFIHFVDGQTKTYRNCLLISYIVTTVFHRTLNHKSENS